MPNVDWVFEAVKTLDQALPVIGPGGPQLACRVGDLPDAGAEQFLLGAARNALALRSQSYYVSRAARDPDYWVGYYSSQPYSFSGRPPYPANWPLTVPSWVQEIATVDNALRVLGAGPWTDSMPQDLDDERAVNFLVGAARCALLFSSDPRYSKTAEAYSDYWRMYFANQPRT